MWKHVLRLNHQTITTTTTTTHHPSSIIHQPPTIKSRKDKKGQPCPRPCQEKMRQRVRTCHETVNRRFTQFGILKQVYHHDREDYGTILHAVVVLTQLSFQLGDSFSAVEYIFSYLFIYSGHFTSSPVSARSYSEAGQPAQIQTVTASLTGGHSSL
jgi:hypothetical protein